MFAAFLPKETFADVCLLRANPRFLPSLSAQYLFAFF